MTDTKPGFSEEAKEWKVALPLSKTKTIMKLDPNCQLIPQDALYAITVAAQLFLELLTMEAHQFSLQQANAINDIHEFEFLTEIVPFKIPYQQAIEQRDAFNEAQEAAQEL